MKRMWEMNAGDAWDFHFDKAGRWWDSNTESDIVAIDRTGNHIIFGECKSWTGKVGVEVLAELEQKAGEVDWRKDMQKTVKTGMTVKPKAELLQTGMENRAENEKNGIMGRIKSKGIPIALWLLLLGMLFTGCTDDRNTEEGTGASAGYAEDLATAEEEGKTASAKPSGETAEAGEVHVCFLKSAEDADCIIIRSGQQAVMIDTGEKQDGERMLDELKEQGITAVDYLILTHPDKDHVGGAELLLDSLPVYHVVEPVYVGEEKKEERLERINESCEEKGISVVCLTDELLEISIGYVDLTVYPPQEAYYEKANNYSLAVLASHREVHMFFTGDALRIRSEELLEIELPEIDLYKVPHHGRANKATEELFEKVSPKYAVVTAGAAEDEVIQSCEKLGVQLFLTGEQRWEFISDGKELRPAEGE